MKQIVLSTFFSIVAIQSTYSQVLRWSYDIQAPQGYTINFDSTMSSFGWGAQATPGGDIAFPIELVSHTDGSYLTEVYILSKTGVLKSKFVLPNGRQYASVERLTPTHIYLTGYTFDDVLGDQYFVSTYRRSSTTAVMVGDQTFSSYPNSPGRAGAPRGFFVTENAEITENGLSRLRIDYYDFVPPRL